MFWRNDTSSSVTAKEVKRMGRMPAGLQRFGGRVRELALDGPQLLGVLGGKVSSELTKGQRQDVREESRGGGKSGCGRQKQSQPEHLAGQHRDPS